MGHNSTQEKQYSNNYSTSFKEKGNKSSLLLGNCFWFIKLIDHMELSVFSLVS